MKLRAQQICLVADKDYTKAVKERRMEDTLKKCKTHGTQ